MREDSYSEIIQRRFEFYDEAKKYFDDMCEFYIFCKLCSVLEENEYEF
jgi:hypothetical protein